jgi:glycosyltransferase involved in cell wall biosynthesis
VANVKQFRGPFYRRLAEDLSRDGVDLTVVFSEPSRSEATKRDSISLPPPLGRRVTGIYMLGNRLLLQLLPVDVLVKADLVIVIQANGYLLNYPLLLLSLLRMKKLAFWGHGYNRQGRRLSISERFKRWLAAAPDWWFAYTDKTTQYLEALGMPANRITTINNAIDTTAFAAEVARARAQGSDVIRQRLGFAPDHRVGLYCGSLYREKRLEYLIAAADEIFRRVPAFRLIIAGAGPESDLVAAAQRERSYLHYVGTTFGGDKAAYFALADVILNPGLVGLGILDCFAAGLPFVTTSDALHSPEIDYLVPGVNGLTVDGDPSRFAQQVVEVLGNAKLAAGIADAARQTAQVITLENMIARVRVGICCCLGRDADAARGWSGTCAS